MFLVCFFFLLSPNDFLRVVAAFSGIDWPSLWKIIQIRESFYAVFFPRSFSEIKFPLKSTGCFPPVRSTGSCPVSAGIMQAPLTRQTVKWVFLSHYGPSSQNLFKNFSLRIIGWIDYNSSLEMTAR